MVEAPYFLAFLATYAKNVSMVRKTLSYPCKSNIYWKSNFRLHILNISWDTHVWFYTKIIKLKFSNAYLTDGNLLTFIDITSDKYPFFKLVLANWGALSVSLVKQKREKQILKQLRHKCNFVPWNTLWTWPDSNVDLADVMRGSQTMFWSTPVPLELHFNLILLHQKWKTFGDKKKSSYITVLYKLNCISPV